MGELAVQAICDNIINDANKKADGIINDAKQKASIILDEARKKADNYGKELMAKATNEFNAEKKRLISAKKMSAKKEILCVKQEIIENILCSAKTYIENSPDDNYKKLLLSLVSKSAMELENAQIVDIHLPQRANKLISEREIKKTIGEKKLSSVKFLKDLTSGVVIISKNIELSNGISEIIREKRDSLSDLICNMLLKEE